MIKSFKKFFVYHPLSLEKTGLIVKITAFTYCRKTGCHEMDKKNKRKRY